VVLLRIIRGDATSPQAKGPEIIAHVCNDLDGRLSATVHMPRIGCGLAGGRWERIEPLIIASLCDRDIVATVYDHD
jgi:hypothetical protein